MAALDVGISCPISRDTSQRMIIDALWGSLLAPTGLEHFIDSYNKECLDAHGDEPRLQWTHRDVIVTAQGIRRGATKAELIAQLENQRQTQQAKLQRQKPTDEDLGNFVDLAGRIISMVHVGELGARVLGRVELPWDTTVSLSQCLTVHFSEQRKTSGENVKLEPFFNARNLSLVAGIEIQWTSNLAEHLLLFDDESKVFLFHQAAFLKAQQRRSQNLQEGSCVLPASLIQETLDTLALLLPQSDAKLAKWYKKLIKRQRLDPGLIRCGSLRGKDRRIQHFEFWRDRLTTLKLAFDDAEPKGMEQWWYDRRRRVQWYTFWVAILILVLTVVFGAGQLVVGILQAYKAYHP